ncbi:hypothetical protein E0H22_06875 [Rhodopseudomonas boonkerdii]|uniref:hypothetical protein n=1 Tax=Rhodopseudomonas boonkerdii TaxID=475937 RepID=UPI001E58DDFE|nr:hypothetical protein [Rhodopseudomonas boonkerdii]UGV25430.1 hypothetical protein E0H22_06875 [Rhodopseudomonas boonkerdii]
MKVILLILLGLLLGLLGGGALGLGAGVAWVEMFKTTNFEGYNAMLVFFTFMPIGALLGAVAGAILFGIAAARPQKLSAEHLRQNDHAAFRSQHDI